MNNQIEIAWSSIKRRLYKKELSDPLRHRDEFDFLWDVKTAVREVVSKNHDSFLTAANKYILRYLLIA